MSLYCNWEKRVFDLNVTLFFFTSVVILVENFVEFLVFKFLYSNPLWNENKLFSYFTDQH